MAGDSHHDVADAAHSMSEAASETVHHATGLDAIFGDPTFWATIAVLIFLGILVWKKIPDVIGKSLDDRAKKISDELDHARILREKAQAALAEAERRQTEAEADAREIVEAAKREAKDFAEQSKADLEERMARREKMAADRIARAEVEATQQVRAAAAEAASSAAAAIMQDSADTSKTFAAGLEEVKKALS